MPTSFDDAERLRLFISSVTDYAIYMLSPEGNVVSWNAGAQRFKGYTEQEILGEHFSRFYTDEDRRAGVPAGALRIAREQGRFEAEGWRQRKDGSRFWASVVIDAIRDADGTLVGFAKVTRDITDKKRAQEALKESEERFRLLVQGVTDYAIYMLSPSGEITNWNTGARRIKGYGDDEVLGTHFSRFYTDEDRATGLPDRALRTAAEQGRFESEGWRVRKDGSRFWAHVIVDAIRNEMGELVGFAKITRDITERRDAAQQLQLAQEALLQAQKLEAIGQLTGGVAHDFNNLLNVLTNGLSLLRQRMKDAESVSLLTSMEAAAERGAALTQQLLAFARQQPLKQEIRDLGRIISSFEPVLRRGSRNGLSFELALTPALPPVKIDAAQFETALLNLVVNARDATDDGGRIAISTRLVQAREGEIGQLRPGKYVAVAVEDTGAGMAPDVLARAFEPFFTTKPVGRGTGLGLSQVLGQVQQSGGDVTLKSAPGKGTTVTMYFPALEGSVDIDHEETQEAVLVVDDQPEVLDMASEMFRTLGLEVLAANSATHALEILRRRPDVSLLFTDVVMPEMTGVELAKAAKKELPDLKVILSSGFSAPAGDLEDFEYLPKPYRLGDLVKKLRVLG